MKLNRKARVELVQIIEDNRIRSSCKVLQWQDKEGRYLDVSAGSNHRRRKVVLVPIFLSDEVRKLNPDVKFGDKLLVIFDMDEHRIMTVLPERKIGDTVYKSTYKIGEAKWY